MNFTLTLTGENPSELSLFLSALDNMRQGDNTQITIAAPRRTLGIITDTALANVLKEGADAPAPTDAATNGTAPAPEATEAPVKKKGSAATKSKKTEEKAPVVANIPADEPAEDFAAAFANNIEEAAATDDFDFGLDLGEKSTGWTVEEVREKAKEVVNAGKQLQLREHLNAFGAASISMLDAAHYDAFMQRMKGINF